MCFATYFCKHLFYCYNRWKPKQKTILYKYFGCFKKIQTNSPLVISNAKTCFISFDVNRQEQFLRIGSNFRFLYSNDVSFIKFKCYGLDIKMYFALQNYFNSPSYIQGLMNRGISVLFIKNKCKISVSLLFDKD